MSFEETPWDAIIYGMPTFEIDHSESDLEQAIRRPGHYTVRVDPLVDKRLLHAYGFYYCDTLIEPSCTSERFRFSDHPDFTAGPCYSVDELIGIGHGAFSHGRFHRDFNLDRDLADLRYDRWLENLQKEGKVLGLYRGEELCGFIGHSGGKLLLHALEESSRGKGYGKYFWSAACRKIFDQGEKEISSSISASNLAVLNLYASLGFRFGHATDIYHLLVK